MSPSPSSSTSSAIVPVIITKTINIPVAPGLVWDYVNDLSKWPEWAIHNVQAARKGENGFWLMDGPRGTAQVKMKSDKTTGLLDHDFIDPGEGQWTVPCRVVASGEGAYFMMTFTKPAPMPVEAFEQAMQFMDDELCRLKQNLTSPGNSAQPARAPFTLPQIDRAYSRVKSTADFPQYTQALGKLGVVTYDHFVADGHNEYNGTGHVLATAPAGSLLVVAACGDRQTLQHAITIHNQGQTNYSVFCQQAAEAGVAKWTVRPQEMTCTYYDRQGQPLLVEPIPLPSVSQP